MLNFLKRSNFSLRRVTASGWYLPTNVVERTYNFYSRLTEMIEEHKFTPSQICNMDEIAIYLDAPGTNF
jgi:hypothetical protein